jgi:glycosyltransferase involved in cell wall biosynthesis
LIVIYHNNNCITNIESKEDKKILLDKKKSIAYGLMQLAIQFPESNIVWCHQDIKGQINLTEIPEIMHHHKMMLSYNSSDNYLGTRIGYVEDSPFINVNKKVTYSTWQMSSLVGVIHASVLLAFKDKIKLDSDFNYYLSSIAKIGMPLGLLCYSEPKLLINAPIETRSKVSVFKLFKFVKQHYKTRWIFLLLLNLLVYEFQFPFLGLIYVLFFKNRNKLSISLANIPVQSNRIVTQLETIDVIIPTIGRKEYLYDVLKDLAQQTHLPINVIIVEQNPQKDSVSELDYLQTEKWPFIIKHTFTHQPGACNARNLALNQVESEWMFLADDDIRIESLFFEQALKQIATLGIKAISISCLKKEERQVFNSIIQWPSFGSGCSIVASESVKGCVFDLSFEFGFGEDLDYGRQLRNKGFDILYLPNPRVEHLKAPIGGFRTKPKLQWKEDNIQPKPFPTVFLYILKNNTKEQLLGYKTTLFFKYYKHQKIKNPINYLMHYRKQWNRSAFWANKLKAQQ